MRSRDVEELLQERGVRVDHTTVFRWVQRDAPELAKRCRPCRRARNNSYRVDETDIKLKKQGPSLYRAVDSTGATRDFRWSASRNAAVAERFFRPVLQAAHALTPCGSTGDQSPAYPLAGDALQYDGTLPETCRLRQGKDLQSMVEPEHRLVKRRVNPGLGVGAFATAPRTIDGYEALSMRREGQIEGLVKRDVRAQKRMRNRLFGVAAERAVPQPLLIRQSVLATLPSHYEESPQNQSY